MAPGRNILLLIADDLGKTLGCYGETNIRTLSIDKLANSGTLFTNAFASTASCSGSRSVIYTGLHTHQNGQYGLGHGKHHFMTFDEIATAPKLLREAGYLTGIVGKIHVGPDHVYPWEVRRESPTRDMDWVAGEAERFFDAAQAEDKPWFLTVGFMDPHRDSTRAGFGNAEYGFSSTYNPANVTVPDFLPDLPEVRAEIAEYYQAVSRMDHGVGMILESLKRSGFDQETLVIFTSDNGPPFLNSKTTLYDAGVHLPMIVRDPTSAAGTTNSNLISWVDILPTMLDWAGVEKSHHVNGESKSPARPGRSFLPIMDANNIQDDWTKVFGSHTFHEVSNYYPTRFIRTARCKYHRNIAWKLDFPFSTDLYASLSWEAIRNSKSTMIGARPLHAYVQRPPEELYDLDEDPLEVRNLADNAKYRDLLLQFRKEMEDWQRATKDPWLFRDGVSLLEMQPHLDAGLVIPDRFDFDVYNPGTKNKVRQ